MNRKSIISIIITFAAGIGIQFHLGTGSGADITTKIAALFGGAIGVLIVVVIVPLIVALIGTATKKRFPNDTFSTFVYIMLVIIGGMMIIGNSTMRNFENSIGSLEQTTTSQNKIECQESVEFGDLKVCLIRIEGMQECYSQPLLRELADMTSTYGNETLAIYVSDETYNQAVKGYINKSEPVLDDYFRIYGTTVGKGQKMDMSVLNMVFDAVELNLDKNWDKIKNDYVDNYIEMDIQTDNPVMVEKYKPHENVRTVLMFNHFITNNQEVYSIAALNFIMIRDRIISMTYHKFYDGKEETIKFVKSKNDYFISRLLEANGII